MLRLEHAEIRGSHPPRLNRPARGPRRNRRFVSELLQIRPGQRLAEPDSVGVSRLPATDWIECAASVFLAKRRVGVLQRMNGIGRDAVHIEIVIDEAFDVGQHSARVADQLLEPNLQIRAVDTLVRTDGPI